jgi:hypothetical protein
MSVFSVLVKSTEMTGIEAAAAAAGGKENIGDVPLVGLVGSRYLWPPPGGIRYGGKFPNSTTQAITNELPVRNVFSNHTNLL